MSSTVRSKVEQPIHSHFFASSDSSDIPQGSSTNIRLPRALCGQGLGDGGHTQRGDTNAQKRMHTHTDLMDNRASSREQGCADLVSVFSLAASPAQMY